FAEPRTLGDLTSPGGGQRLLYRAAAHGIGKCERLDGGFSAAIGVASQQADIRFDDCLQHLAARSDRRGIVILGIFPRRGDHGWNSKLELANRICVASGPCITDRQSATSPGGVVMAFADPRLLALDE